MTFYKILAPPCKQDNMVVQRIPQWSCVNRQNTSAITLFTCQQTQVKLQLLFVITSCHPVFQWDCMFNVGVHHKDRFQCIPEWSLYRMAFVLTAADESLTFDNTTHIITRMRLIRIFITKNCTAITFIYVLHDEVVICNNIRFNIFIK